MTALPTLHDGKGGKGNNGVALQINNFGEVVGSAENTTLDSTCPVVTGPSQKFQFKPVTWFKPFFWFPAEAHELPTVAGDQDGVAFAINQIGQAVGTSGNCTFFNTISLDNLVPLHAVLWQNGTATDLGNLGGDGLFGGIYADGLNNRGQVVGSSDTTNDSNFHAFLWQKGKMTDLKTLPGDVNSVAVAINDSGQIVGLSLDASFNPRAVLWQNGKPTDLNTFIPSNSSLVLVTGCSINSSGEIIGIAVNATTMESHAYLAIPSFNEPTRENDAPATDGASSERANLPENVRDLIRQRWSFVQPAIRLAPE